MCFYNVRTSPSCASGFWVHWCALQLCSNNAGASTVSAQFMNPGPLCTRRLVWCSVCGALPENEFSLKHMPPADFFPFLIWNSNFYNEHQFPVWRGGWCFFISFFFWKKFDTIYATRFGRLQVFSNKLALSFCGQQEKKKKSRPRGPNRRFRCQRRGKTNQLLWFSTSHVHMTGVAVGMELPEL